MAKKKEDAGVARKSELTLWASPSWKLIRNGTEVYIDSPGGFYPHEKPTLVKVKITVEEI